MAAASAKDRASGSAAMQGGLHSLAVQIFTGTAVLMIAALILMSFTLSSLKTSHLQAEAAEDTLLEITTIESRLLASEAALNGLVISGDARYAQRIAWGRKEIDIAMAKLARSVSQDGEMAAIYRDMAGLLARRQAAFDYLADPIHHGEVARIGSSTAADAEHRRTSALRGRLWDLLKLERAKRLAQHTDMIAEAARSIWIAVGIVVLAILSGALSLFLAGLNRRMGSV
jgi:CHASE3 domain sensor protein